MLEDSDEEFEMFFQTPEQIENIFESLEEKSLFMISNTKETEQGYENKRHEYEEMIAKFNQQLKIKKANKADLEKSVKVIIEI